MMRERATMNAMRSGLVVFGALAFSYLTMRLGFKPFLENAQRTMELQSKDPISPDSHQDGGDEVSRGF